MVADLAEACGKKVKRDVPRIIPDLLTGKVFGADCWSFLTPVLPCRLYQGCFFIQYLLDRYRVVGYREIFS